MPWLFKERTTIQTIIIKTKGIIRTITTGIKQDRDLNDAYCYKLYAPLVTTSCFE